MQFLLLRRRVVLLQVLDASLGCIPTPIIIELTEKGPHLWTSGITAVGRREFTSISSMNVMRMFL